MKYAKQWVDHGEAFTMMQALGVLSNHNCYIAIKSEFATTIYKDLLLLRVYHVLSLNSSSLLLKLWN